MALCNLQNMWPDALLCHDTAASRNLTFHCFVTTHVEMKVDMIPEDEIKK